MTIHYHGFLLPPVSRLNSGDIKVFYNNIKQEHIVFLVLKLIFFSTNLLEKQQ